MHFEMMQQDSARIVVVGVGGGGGNAVDRMIQVGVGGVEYLVLNTDAGVLAKSKSPVKMRIGDRVCRGLGCGGSPQVGSKAAEESRDEIAKLLEGADMVFVTAGMGGGTGTGAAPLVAQTARDLGALTVAIVTKPFFFEAGKRTKVADEGITRLSDHVDTLIVVPNDRLLSLAGNDATVDEAFLMADDVLRQGIQGISDLVTTTGLVNLDFNDVRSIMQNGGSALMAIGSGKGENRAVEAATRAVQSKLLDVQIDGARGVLYNIKASPSLGMREVGEAADVIRQMVHPEANIIFGTTIDEAMGDELQITLVATGFDDPAQRERERARSVAGRGHAVAAVAQQPTVVTGQGFNRGNDDLPPFLTQHTRR